MSTSLITRTAPINYVTGLLVNNANMTLDEQNEVNHIGEAVCSILGVVDCLPKYNPCTISPSGLVLTVGGVGGDGSPQLLITQGRLCDYILPTTFNTPTATGVGSTRIDLLAVQFTTYSISGIVPNQIVKDSMGDNNSQTIGINYNGVTWDYVVGTPGSGQPATPGGYEAFATITMSGGASSVGPSQIAYLFPTVIQQLGSSEITKYGVQTGVPCDGSAESTVTFGTAFPSAIDSIQATIDLNGTAGFAATVLIDRSFSAAASFKIYATGGPIGGTVKVNWTALGH